MVTRPGIEIGDVLAGRYEVVGRIGQGGMGEVLEGVHQGLGQRVAIKVLRRDSKHDAELFARFAREAKAAAQLKSKNAVSVTDVDTTDDGTPFMVMELLDGHDLDVELEREGRIEMRQAVTYILQTCSAMAEAHGLGIVHRDLKPQNLFLAYEGDDVVLKVLDFGISKVDDEASKSITKTSSSLGTPLYMSPEQIRSAKHVDARTDIWSLGVILYEMLHGAPPFDADNPTAIIAAITADTPVPLWLARPELPRALCDVVMRALEKKPDARYPDIVSFAAALAPFGDAAAFERPSMRSMTSLAGRTDLSAPGLAATQRSDTNGSWETSPLKKPFATKHLALLAGAAAIALTVGGVWLARGNGATDVPVPAAQPTTEAPGPTVNTPPIETPEPAASPTPSVAASTSAAPAPTAVASPKPLPRRLPAPRVVPAPVEPPPKTTPPAPQRTPPPRL